MNEITKRRSALAAAFACGCGIVVAMAVYLFGCVKPALDPNAVDFGTALVQCVREAGTRSQADDCRADVERRWDAGTVE